MAQLTRVDGTSGWPPEIETFLSEAVRGKRDTLSLRMVLNKISSSEIERTTGLHVVECEKCSYACFASKSTPVYHNRYTVCDVCAGRYVFCGGCGTLVLREDLLDDMHEHEGKSKEITM